jgi:Ca-activated chloride channel family protein
MKFAEPIWLIAGLVVLVALVFLYWWFDRRQRAALAAFASSHLLSRLTSSFSPLRRAIKRGFFLAALACVFVALARPQWGYHWTEEKETGIDLLFAIDTSKSMLTQDVTPDRLTRAKLAITDFVRKLDGDRVGLLAFAGEAFLQAPLTLDYNAFQDTLDTIDVNTIPRGGTDISSAIDEAQAAFGDAPNTKKILILLTDGEDLEGSSVDVARRAAKNGMIIYTVGVGTSSGGLIPVPTPDGGTDFLKDASGQFVKSHLDESTLEQIAEVTGGIYQPLGQQGQGLGVIYDKALASLPKHQLASRRAKVYEERFQWPLAAGIALLLGGMLIGTRRNDGGARGGKSMVRLRTSRAAAVLAALVLVPMAAQASVQSAERAYHRGDFQTAKSQYEEAAAQHPDEAHIQYNLGAADYKAGAYADALPAFQKALRSDDVGVQQQSYYNMGNAQYRIGQKTEKSSPPDTIKTWQSAVSSYENALKLKPDDADAKFNHDFVEKKLEKYEQEHPQPQQQKKDQNQQDKKQQDQQNQNQQNQDQQQNQQQQNSGNQNQQQQQNQSSSGSQKDQQNSQGGNQSQNQGQGGQGNSPDQQQQQNGQNQAKNDDQKKDQNGNQQTAGDQQPKPQGGDEKNPQNGNGGDQQSQTAQNNPGGQSGQAGGQSKDQSGQNASAQVVPAGELSKEEAKDLLNSLKGEEHLLPVTADSRTNGGHPQDQSVEKDW